MQLVWGKAIQAQAVAATGGVLNAPHQIFFLCEHALRAELGRLVLIHDIDPVIRHHEKVFNWDELISESRAFGLSSADYSGSTMSGITFRTPSRTRS